MKIEPLLNRLEDIEADIATLRDWGATVQADTLAQACSRFHTIIDLWLDER